MSLKFRKKLLLCKIEATEGVDAVPTGAVNAVLTHNLEITALEGSVVERETDRPTLGNDLSFHVGTHVKCSFEVEFAGSGALGVAPAYGPVLRASSLAQTVVASTSVEYTPVSSNDESCTMYIHLDGQKHAMVGAKGNWGFTLSPEGIPRFKFDFIGLWVDPVSVVDPVADTSAFKVPLAVTNANTPTLTLHGATYNVSDFSYDHANSVKYRNVIGQEAVITTDRKPKGSVTIDAPVLSDKNWFVDIKANDTGAVNLVHGVSDGGILQVDFPIVQMLNPSYVNEDDIRGLKMDMNVTPSSAGDDEVKIIIR